MKSPTPLDVTTLPQSDVPTLEEAIERNIAISNLALQIMVQLPYAYVDKLAVLARATELTQQIFAA